MIVESGQEPRPVWRRSKLKIDTLVLTDIPRCLQGHTNKQKYVSGVIYKQHAYTLKEFLQFLLIICTERNKLALLSGKLFPSLIILCCYGPQYS